MATFYEALGVEPDAEHRDLKRAYSRLARRYHPDLKADTTDEERERAATLMKELNAIWAVLSDPVSRAEYDRSISFAGATTDAPTVPQDQMRSAAPTSTSRADIDFDVGTDVEEERDLHAAVETDIDRRGLWIGMSVIGVVLIAALIALVASRGSQNLPGTVSGPGAQMAAFVGNGSRPAIDWSVVEPGRCVVLGSYEGRVLAVPTECSTHGAYRIAVVVGPGESCPDGLDPFDLTYGARRLCMSPV